MEILVNVGFWERNSELHSERVCVVPDRSYQGHSHTAGLVHQMLHQSLLLSDGKAAYI